MTYNFQNPEDILAIELASNAVNSGFDVQIETTADLLLINNSPSIFLGEALQMKRVISEKPNSVYSKSNFPHAVEQISGLSDVTERPYGYTRSVYIQVLHDNHPIYEQTVEGIGHDINNSLQESLEKLGDSEEIILHRVYIQRGEEVIIYDINADFQAIYQETVQYEDVFK